MAARGLFINFTLAQVQQIHAAAFALIATPKQIMSVSAEGKSSSKQFSMPVEDVLEECNYALTAIMNGGVVIRRVKSDFSRGVR